jgi:hypothetical protein
MPRQSFRAATLSEKTRADGSHYLIGGWHDLTVFIQPSRDDPGAWEMTLSERKPAAARNLANSHAAKAARLALKQTAARERGDRKAAILGSVARLHGKVAAALIGEAENGQTD